MLDDEFRATCTLTSASPRKSGNRIRLFYKRHNSFDVLRQIFYGYNKTNEKEWPTRGHERLALFVGGSVWLIAFLALAPYSGSRAYKSRISLQRIWAHRYC